MYHVEGTLTIFSLTLF